MSETDSPAVQPSLISLLGALLRPRRSASEARRRIRRRIEEVRAVAREVEEVMTALPEPAPEDLQAMVNGTLPWTPEAHMLALLREVRSRLLAACELMDQHGRHSPSSLLHRWHVRAEVDPHLLSALRAVAVARRG
jgi:hypothetical protein